MRRKPPRSSVDGQPSRRQEDNGSGTADEVKPVGDRLRVSRRSGVVWLTLCLLVTYSSWAVYQYQFQDLPQPVAAKHAGKRGFSEVEARKHVSALTQLGPHPVSSDALELGVQYVLEAAEKIKATAHWEVEIEVDTFQAKSGANRLASGMFKGRTVVYSDLSHVVLRILPKYAPEAVDNAVLVSSHIDTVFSTEGAGDCSSCVAVMLELARCISQWAHGFKNAIIFLFNTGEEEGLNGAHSFITQHPWSSSISVAIDLEAMGIGGRSSIFQAGPDPWALENFAAVAKFPSAQIIAQDLFSSGAIKSATDFQVYEEVAGLSGLDFAFVDRTAVYHTKNDKYEALTPGSLQHLGENMLAFLLRAGTSHDLPKAKAVKERKGTRYDSAIYFDILGKYIIVYHQSFAKWLHGSIIMQSILMLVTSLLMGGYPAVASLALSCLGSVLTWTFSIAFPLLVSFLLPHISSSPVPYVAFSWLVVGLFVAPSILGALTGQHLAFIILWKYLSNEYLKRNQFSAKMSDDLAKLEAERWIFKSGFIQWLLLLILGTYYEVGSSFLALVWLVPPAFAYGLLEATLAPVRLPKPLKLTTIILSMAAPVLLSSGILIRLANTLIGMVVRFDRNPGGAPEWLWNAMISVFLAAIVCLTLVYLLAYFHLSDAKRSFMVALCLAFGLSIILVSSNAIPAFTQNTARAVNVVHVVDTSTRSTDTQAPTSFVSLFSTTPGNLRGEAELIKEGFTCGRGRMIDLINFQVKYGCVTYEDARVGWNEASIPTMSVETESNNGNRVTKVAIDTKGSTRWVLAINMKEVEDFTFTAGLEELVPLDDKTSVKGWHVIQFSGGKSAPTRFVLSLHGANGSILHNHSSAGQSEDQQPLLKLRTDVNRITPKVEKVLAKLPAWCSVFGKSTSPFTLSFLASLPANR